MKSLHVFIGFHANDTSAYNPTLWAYEGITLLWERMGMGRCVNVDSNPTIASFGETVTTRKVNKFQAKRKTPTDNVTVQDATATGLNVVLNQLPHVSFALNDTEMSKSFKDLVPEFLDPAMWAMAKIIDQILYAQFAQFLSNGVGRLGNMTSSTVKQDMLDARKQMNDNLVPDENRNLFWSTNGESKALATDLFIAANQRGDNGNALENAALGRVLGFNNFMTQQAPTVPATTRVTGAINNAAGYPAGTTSFTVDGFSAAITAGCYITIAGDDTPLRVASTTGGATPTAIVTATASKKAVVDNAVVTVYTPALINNAGGYAAGWAKEIIIDTAAIFPAVGQLIAFKVASTNPDVYVVIQSNSTAGTILLDRPLVAAVADNDVVALGPAGDYNFAFDRDAIMLVNRPLATPMAGVGAFSRVAMVNDFAIRCTITYNGTSQQHLVTLDCLLGVAIRDTARGVPLYG